MRRPSMRVKWKWSDDEVRNNILSILKRLIFDHVNIVQQIATLREFVKSHKEKFWGDPIEYIEWQDIGLQLGRTPKACSTKYSKDVDLADQSIESEGKVKFTNVKY